MKPGEKRVVMDLAEGSRIISRNIPASAPTIRKERRALVKALGSRQFKKLYRSVP